jgi:hypothetical protein
MVNLPFFLLVKPQDENFVLLRGINILLLILCCFHECSIDIVNNIVFLSSWIMILSMILVLRLLC